MTGDVYDSLRDFFERALEAAGDRSFRARYDPDWRSDCELHQQGEVTFWRPLEQIPPVCFSGLANAAGQDIHPDISAYYGSFWAGTILARSREGEASLIQLWNPDDFERLIANLIGHLLMKQRARQPFTVFFANTGMDSQYFLSIDNETGTVLLEEPGKPPIREVETDISTFLRRLTPVPGEPDLY